MPPQQTIISATRWTGVEDHSKLTFKVENKDKGLPWRFAVNIIVCYLAAFSVAQPLVRKVLASQPQVIVDNVAMFLGMCMFIVLNFFGQKLFVFRKTKKHQAGM